MLLCALTEYMVIRRVYGPLSSALRPNKVDLPTQAKAKYGSARCLQMLLRIESSAVADGRRRFLFDLLTQNHRKCGGPKIPFRWSFGGRLVLFCFSVTGKRSMRVTCCRTNALPDLEPPLAPPSRKIRQSSLRVTLRCP